MRLGVRGFGVLTLGTLVGCSGTGETSTVSVVDSAGVAVVTNLAGSIEAVERWTLADQPHVDIGSGADAEEPLYRVTAVLPMDDGSIAVGLASPPRAIVFDRTGSAIRTLGGPGDGPGEFLAVASVVPLADRTVGVWDPYRRRLSEFDSDGRLVRDLDLSDAVPQAPGSAASAETTSGYAHIRRIEDGLIVFAEAAMGPGPDTGAYRPELPSVRLSLAGERMGTFGVFPGLQIVAPFGLPQPFGPRTYAAPIGEHLVIGTGTAAEFRVASSSGDIVRIVRWPHQPRPAEGAVQTRWEGFLAERPQISEVVGALPRPSVLPAHSDIVTSDDGLVFVSDYPGPVGPMSLRRADDAPEAGRPLIPVPERRWLVFSDQGELVATIVTPEGFEPQRVVDRSMWGVFEDALGVESVRAFRIAQP